jgi:hypothetical protein
MLFFIFLFFDNLAVCITHAIINPIIKQKQAIIIIKVVVKTEILKALMSKVYKVVS